MSQHSIYFYGIIAIMGLAGLTAAGTGGLFFVRRVGEKRANAFFGCLLIAFGLTQWHNVLTLMDFYETHPQWRFLPIYFTLSFPVLLFYYVKLSLYPTYRFQRTDIKHFVLPVSQWLFFCLVLIQPLKQKLIAGRGFYNPFYGALEQAIYLGTFFAYMYFAYRYIRQKRKHIRGKKEAWRVLYLDKLVKILFILFSGHTLLVVTDFAAYEFINVNMRAFKPYAAFSVLSFTAIVGWLSAYGGQVLIWGKRIFADERKSSVGLDAGN